MKLDDILIAAHKIGASDIHLKIFKEPVVRKNRKLQILEGFGKLDKDLLEEYIKQVVPSEQKRKLLEENGEIDISYSIHKVSRYRVNIYKQRGTYAFAFRALKTEVPNIDELMLPKKLYDIALEPRGLILVTGPTGSGKSTTLASMIDYRNSKERDVIITIEDPIEYLFSDKNCYIVQREVSLDTKEFSTALKAALREDPDVIMVGEMRDIETIEIALRSAETGHLVFSTLHTNDAKETINRIIDVFPLEAQRHIRLLLASTLSAVISQRLIPRKDGNGIVPAVEILINTAAVQDAIMDVDKFSTIYDLMEKGTKQYGMQTFDQSILNLYNEGYISYEDAVSNASNPSDLILKIKGISSGEIGEDFFNFGG